MYLEWNSLIIYFSTNIRFRIGYCIYLKVGLFKFDLIMRDVRCIIYVILIWMATTFLPIYSFTGGNRIAQIGVIKRQLLAPEIFTNIDARTRSVQCFCIFLVNSVDNISIDISIDVFPRLSSWFHHLLISESEQQNSEWIRLIHL